MRLDSFNLNYMKYEIDQSYLISLLKDFFNSYKKESGISVIIRKRRNSKGICVYFKNIKSIYIYFDHRIQCNILIGDHKLPSKSKICDIVTSFDVFPYKKGDKYYDPFLIETKKYDSIEELLYVNMFDPLSLWLIENITPNSEGLIKKVFYDTDGSYYKGIIIEKSLIF